MTGKKIDKRYKYHKLNRIKIGDTISLSTRVYAISYNSGLKRLSRVKEKPLSDSDINRLIKEKKLSRPVLILYNNPFHKYMIAASLTTKEKKKYHAFNIEKYSEIVNNKNIKSKSIKYELLIINKERNHIKNYLDNANIFNHLSKQIVGDYLSNLKKYKPEISKAIKILKDQIEIEVDLLKENNKLSEEIRKIKNK